MQVRTLDNLECDGAVPFNIQVPSDRQVVVNLLIHSADLSAQCFPTTVARVWEERITREFEHQAAREKAQGIQVAEFMQNLSNPLLRRQNQVNFIDVVLVPWWRACTRIFPGFRACYKNLLVNRAYYNNSDEEHSTAPSPQSLSSTVNLPPQPQQPPLQPGAQRSNQSHAHGHAQPEQKDDVDGDDDSSEVALAAHLDQQLGVDGEEQLERDSETEQIDHTHAHAHDHEQ